MNPRKKWDLRLNADSASEDSSDDIMPDHDPRAVAPIPRPLPTPPSFPPPIRDDFVEFPPPMPSPEDSSHETPPRFIRSQAARRTSEILRALESDSDESFSYPDSNESRPEPPPPAISESSSESDSDSPRRPPVLKTLRQSNPIPLQHVPKQAGKRRFVKTVKAIYDFFQGDYPMATILQAIHGCAGDYKKAVVRLTQGFTGTHILQIPAMQADGPSSTDLRIYLRGK
jgi:hypothetical protein